MEFRIAPEIFAAFPGLRIAVAVATGVDNARDNPAVARGWEEAWRAAGAAGATHGNAQSHPRIIPWRERFRAAGVSPKGFPPSHEAMLRRAIRGGEPFRINPLVDFYNTLSLRHTVPVGGFDLAEVAGPLELRPTRDGDTFLALGAAEAVAVPPGEIAYADGATVLTRHFVWRQSRAALIAPATRAVFLVSEVPGEIGPAVADAVLADLQGGLTAFFDVTPQTWIMDAASPGLSW